MSRPFGSKNKIRPILADKMLDTERYQKDNITHKLLPSEQLEVARRIAWFWTNKQIGDFVKESFQKELSCPAFSDMRKQEKWIPVIEKFRDQYIAKCSEVPLFHKRRRLEELQDLYYTFKETGNLAQARLVLQDLRNEAEGKGADISFNFTNVTHNEFHQMTDEDLQREKMKTIEQLEKLRRMKLLTHEGGIDELGNESAEETSGEETETAKEEVLHHE